MKRLLCILAVVLLFSCNNSGNKEKPIVWDGYPRIIDSLGLQKMYDDAKWRIACLYCDDTIVHKNHGPVTDEMLSGIKDTITFGCIELKSTLVKTKGKDTLELGFSHFYKSDSVLSYEYVMGHLPAYGVAYNISADSVLYYLTQWGPVSIWCPSICADRLVKPLQPDVVSYIQKNRDRLDPWFRKEAIKRGVIK